MPDLDRFILYATREYARRTSRRLMSEVKTEPLKVPAAGRVESSTCKEVSISIRSLDPVAGYGECAHYACSILEAKVSRPEPVLPQKPAELRSRDLSGPLYPQPFFIHPIDAEDRVKLRPEENRYQLKPREALREPRARALAGDYPVDLHHVAPLRIKKAFYEK